MSASCKNQDYLSRRKHKRRPSRQAVRYQNGWWHVKDLLTSWIFAAWLVIAGFLRKFKGQELDARKISGRKLSDLYTRPEAGGFAALAGFQKPPRERLSGELGYSV